jgi:hypothetical protein
MNRRITFVIAAVLALGVLVPTFAQTKNKADPRVAAILNNLGLTYKVTSSSNYSVTYDTNDGRTQVVYIMSATDTEQGIEIREIWSNAGYFESEPDATQLVDLMTESGKNSVGDWALEEQDDGTYLLFYTIKSPVKIDNAAFKMMLQYTADTADAREAEIFDTDEN